MVRLPHPRSASPSLAEQDDNQGAPRARHRGSAIRRRCSTSSSLGEPLLESDPTRMCALLVGLPDVVVVGVGEWPRWLRICVTTPTARPGCPGCGGAVHDHGRREVELVDLPVFGRPARLVWAKQRWRCPNRSCPVATWTEQNPQIASTRCALTTRAARWATLPGRRSGSHRLRGRSRARLRLAHGDGRRRGLRDAADRRPATVTARSTRSGWTRRCVCASAATGPRCGQPRSSTSRRAAARRDRRA